jgi:hypothetical protein
LAVRSPTSDRVEPLESSWVVYQGIKTGADAYTIRLQRRLTAEAKAALAARGMKTGDPILEVPPGSEARSPWSENRSLLAVSPEPRAILYGAVDDDDHVNLIWIGRNDNPPPEVVGALEPWRSVLATRFDMVGIPRQGVVPDQASAEGEKRCGSLRPPPRT